MWHYFCRLFPYQSKANCERLYCWCWDTNEGMFTTLWELFVHRITGIYTHYNSSLDYRYIHIVTFLRLNIVLSFVYLSVLYQAICINVCVKKSLKIKKKGNQNRISKKKRPHNDQKKKDKRTNNDLQNIQIKLKIE